MTAITLGQSQCCRAMFRAHKLLFAATIFFLLTQIGCSKVELATHSVQTGSADESEIQQETELKTELKTESKTKAETKAASDKATLQKAAELLRQASSSGGKSAQQATQWMQNVLGDAAESGGATAQDTMRWTNEMYQSLRDQGSTTANSATEWLSEDWSKMGAWEYKVVLLENKSPADMEGKLNELGAQRWECFHVMPTGSGQAMYFKKPARSYLKNVPLKDMMKLIPLLDNGNE